MIIRKRRSTKIHIVGDIENNEMYFCCFCEYYDESGLLMSEHQKTVHPNEWKNTHIKHWNLDHSHRHSNSPVNNTVK